MIDVQWILLFLPGENLTNLLMSTKSPMIFLTLLGTICNKVTSSTYFQTGFPQTFRTFTLCCTKTGPLEFTDTIGTYWWSSQTFFEGSLGIFLLLDCKILRELLSQLFIRDVFTRKHMHPSTGSNECMLVLHGFLEISIVWAWKWLLHVTMDTSAQLDIVVNISVDEIQLLLAIYFL